MKKLSYLIVLALILGLVLTGCSLLSNISQVPTTEQSGITYLTKHTEGAPFVNEDLIADGRDLAIDVGDVLVWNDGNYLYVKYVITDSDWCLTETHLHVVESLDNIHQKNGNPIPGKFPYQCSYNGSEWVFQIKKDGNPGAGCDAADPNLTEPCLSTITYTIPLNGWEAETQLSIAAHAVLQDLNNPIYEDGTDSPIIIGYETETAWADGMDFEGKNWATYFTYTVQQLPEYGLVLWLDAGKGITEPVNGEPVSKWEDQSVNGNDAAQTNSLYQPTYVENGQNGKPVVRFTGEGEQYLSHSPILADDYTAFYVLKLTETGKNKLYYYHAGRVGLGDLGFFAEYSSANVGWGSVGKHPYWGNYFRASGECPTPLNWRIHTHQPNALYKNGDEMVDYALGREVDVYAGNLTTIGSRSHYHVLYFVGDIAEILVYDRILTDSERMMVEAYLNAKYEIY